MDTEKIFQNLKDKAEDVAGKVEDALGDFKEWAQPIMQKSNRWLSAQKWEDLSHGGIIVPYAEVNAYLQEQRDDAEVKLKKVGYHTGGTFVLHLEKKECGELKLFIFPEEFIINKERSYVRLRVVDFAVEKNRFAEAVISALGTDLVMAVVNKIFDDTVIENNTLSCVVNDGVLEIYFTDMINNSKLATTGIMGKNILDVLQFVGLEPQQKGILVKSKFKL